MFDQVDATTGQKAEMLMLAIHSMDDMVEAMDGNAERAIGFMMLAAAVKGGQPALTFMRQYLAVIDEQTIASGEKMFQQEYRSESRQRRRMRVRKGYGRL